MNLVFKRYLFILLGCMSIHINYNMDKYVAQAELHNLIRERGSLSGWDRKRETLSKDKQDEEWLFHCFRSGADSNYLIPIFSPEKGTIIGYKPPLNYSDKPLRPEFVRGLVNEGANPYGETLYFHPDGSTERYSRVIMLLKKNLNSETVTFREVARVCIELEILCENEGLKDKVLEHIEKNTKTYSARLPLGVVYHMLKSDNHNLSTYINSINVFDRDFVARKELTNQLDIFGFMPYEYALFQWWESACINKMRRFIKCYMCEQTFNLRWASPYRCKHVICNNCRNEKYKECPVCNTSSVKDIPNDGLDCRRKKLKWHPDKNRGRAQLAHTIFSMLNKK